ncbi:MAG: hypothetical protein ACLP1X_12540 [Polyangiaceae bacterium]
MQTRRVALTAFLLSVLGLSVLAWLGAKGKLPPTLARTYATMASFASDESDASPGASGEPSTAADAGAGKVRRAAQAMPLSSAQLGAPLVNGKFVTECGAPGDMKVVVKVTIKMGLPVDVTVTTDPANGAVASCVEKATRAMQWPVSSRTQHATVTY